LQKGPHVLLSIENPKDENNSNHIAMKGLGMGLGIVSERIQLFNQEMKTTYQLNFGLPTRHFKVGYRVELYLA